MTLASAAPALADEPAARAADLYDQGAAAYEAGDYNRALHALREADRTVPNDVALELALRAAQRSTLPVVAMEAARIADGRGETLRDLARDVRERFASEVGTIRVLCAACRPRIDGAAASPGEARFVATGAHVVEVESAGRTLRYEVTIAGGRTSDIHIEDPAGRAVPAASSAGGGALAPGRDRSGLPPVVFWAGLGVSATLGAGTAVSAFDTRARFQDFQGSPTEDGARTGRRAQTRTNILAGVTAIASVATALVGVLLIEWDDAPGRAAASDHETSR